MYYYGYQNYAAGVIGILVLAVALTALLVVLVLPKEKDGHLPSVFQMLYDLFSPKTLVMEKLLQILYVFLTCLAVLYGIVVFFSGFFSGFQNLALGLVILAVGPILLRVGYELILLLVMQVKTTREIHQNLVPGLLGPLPRLRQTAGRKRITVSNARRRPRVFLFGQGRSLYRSNHGAVNLTAPDCKRGSGTEAIVI